MSLSLSGCGTGSRQAREAYSDYQAAQASGDLPAVRAALLRLVAAEDDEAKYWAELGKVQMQLSNYGEAFYAFTRAHELDRTDVEVLGILTYLALFSGNPDMAEEKVRLLEMLSPGHPAVNLTRGYIALRRNNFDEADSRADAILASVPSDPQGTLLRARVMIARDQIQEAIDTLESHLQVRSDDIDAMKLLAGLQGMQADHAAVMATAGQMIAASPKDTAPRLMFIEAAFRANAIAEAVKASSALLANGGGGEIEEMLRLWSEHYRSERAIEDAIAMANANPQHVLAFASYFNRAERPDVALEILGDSPQLPVASYNSSRNAIIAEAIGLTGRNREALDILNQVLSIEPDHVHALRARIDLLVRTGSAKAAIRDAQRLITIQPNSADDRLRLARAYAQSGDLRQYDRTLWQAFHEVPGREKLYKALRSHETRKKGDEAVRRIDEEFKLQRSKILMREFA